MKILTEPDITINGYRLSNAQAMTVRVALNAFAMDLQSGLGEDDIGKSMTIGYQSAIRDILTMIHNE